MSTSADIYATALLVRPYNSGLKSWYLYLLFNPLFSMAEECIYRNICLGIPLPECMPNGINNYPESVVRETDDFTQAKSAFEVRYPTPRMKISVGCTLFFLAAR
jgi:hypothetical protein